MKVYRYLSEEELNLIKQGNVQGLGREFDKKDYKRQNNHRYKSGVKYMHFYKNKESIEHIRREYFQLLMQGHKFYFCSFDIPGVVLIKHRGKGHYDGSGYDTMGGVDSVEYAIPVEDFSPSWLRQSILDDNKAHLPKNAEYDDMVKAIKNGTYKRVRWGEGLEL